MKYHPVKLILEEYISVKAVPVKVIPGSLFLSAAAGRWKGKRGDVDGRKG